MRNSAGHAPDTTAAAAVGDVSGELLFAEVRSRIQDERDRLLILQHLALGVPLGELVSQLGMSVRELASRRDTIVAMLREDTELAAMLAGISRAGRPEHHQALAISLGLQEWFCKYAQCGKFLGQRPKPKGGRTREYCCDKHRRLHWGQQRRSSLNGTGAGSGQVQPPVDEAAFRRKLLLLITPGMAAGTGLPGDPTLLHADTRSRDRALLLLGFRCPIPLSPSDLATLDVNDVSQTPRNSLEVLLYGRDPSRKRYVRLPADVDPRLCPLTAVVTWRKRLASSGRTTGPLFPPMGPHGQLSGETVRLTGRDIAKAITRAARYGSRRDTRKITPSTLLPDHLNSARW